MNIFRLSILLIIVLSGCSSAQLDKENKNSSARESMLMDWVKNPNRLCPSIKICGLGEGNNLNSAKANARDEIAKTFSVQVRSSSNYSQNYQSNKNKITLSETQGKEINEVTDQVLEGVLILKTGLFEKKYFVLMQLNVPLANRILNSKITEIEDKVKTLTKINQRGSLLKASRLFQEWLGYTVRWEIINNQKKSRLLFKNVARKLSVKIDKKTKVFLSNSSNNKNFRSQLSDFGYQFTKNEKLADIKVSIVKNSKEVYLKVKGFYKIKKIINLKLIYNDNRTKELNKSWFIIARSKKQLEINAEEKVKYFYKNEIFKLLID